MFSTVDLPAPLGPKITTNSPFSIEKLIPLFATTVFSPTLYLLYVSITSIYAILNLPYMRVLIHIFF